MKFKTAVRLLIAGVWTSNVVEIVYHCSVVKENGRQSGKRLLKTPSPDPESNGELLRPNGNPIPRTHHVRRMVEYLDSGLTLYGRNCGRLKLKY
jgi:hypothetical protein